jgi:23S rRNA pseudouridine2605 synthase
MVDHPREPIARRAPRQGSSTHARKDATPAAAPENAEAAEGDRVAKALARAGVASRREVERLIAEGRVALNGKVLDTPAVKITAADVLTVDGKRVGKPEPARMWRYHKPVGLVSTHSDPTGRPTVFDNLPAGMPRVISVGRLDLNSEGLLLLTNDGALSRALELPANAWVRRYRARAYGRTTQERLDTLKDGVTIEGVNYGAIDATLDKVQHKAGEGLDGPANVWITVVLNEGKNREVRRVLESLDLKVNRLVRLSYGPFALATLPLGAIEEVGPRVIREQLAAYLPPENLPSADRVVTAVSSSRSGQRRPGSKLATALEAVPVRGAEGEAVRPEKPVYKEGWAKPKSRPVRFVAKPGAKKKPLDHDAQTKITRSRLHREAPAGATLISDPSRSRSSSAGKPGDAPRGDEDRRYAGKGRSERSRAGDDRSIQTRFEPVSPNPARASERPSTDTRASRDRPASERPSGERADRAAPARENANRTFITRNDTGDMPTVRERLAAYRKEEAERAPPERSFKSRSDVTSQRAEREDRPSPKKTAKIAGGRFLPGGQAKNDREAPARAQAPSQAANPAADRTRERPSRERPAGDRSTTHRPTGERPSPPRGKGPPRGPR